MPIESITVNCMVILAANTLPDLIYGVGQFLTDNVVRQDHTDIVYHSLKLSSTHCGEVMYHSSATVIYNSILSLAGPFKKCLFQLI